MLHDLSWLNDGAEFPPKHELGRLERYRENEKLFELEHGNSYKEVYLECFKRIEKIYDHFREIKCFPVVLGYHRLLSIKLADLVCGESPLISAESNDLTDEIKDILSDINFNEQLYSSVLDLSRYGDTVWRIYTDEETNKGSFTVWDPMEWYPIVANDGTRRIKQHVLAWRINSGTDDVPDWSLTVQIHEKGKYTERHYALTTDGKLIKNLVSSTEYETGLEDNAVIVISNLKTTSSVYGHDDYMMIDSIITEIMARMGQISKILDQHADPSMAGPESMLTTDQSTGESVFKTGRYYAYGEGEEAPKYVTWDGQLDAAFKQLTLLLEQLYILTELGSAFAGVADKTGQAISGTAMRFKMVSALVKARRVANSLVEPTKKLIKSVSSIGYSKIDTKTLSIQWRDGLPNDPREDAETARLATGMPQVMPLFEAIKRFFEKSPAEATKWFNDIVKDQKMFAEFKSAMNQGSQPASNADPRVNPNPAKKEPTVNNP